jgi:protein ImuB
MYRRRILSLWFPYLAAEHALRSSPDVSNAPFVIIAERHNSLQIHSVSQAAAAKGLSVGQSLSDAHVLCPNLMTAPHNPMVETAVLNALARWAMKFTPWITQTTPDALLLDITGCAHLFGGEETLAQTLVNECSDFRLTAKFGLADTAGAAWALARFAGANIGSDRSGDAIAQEARATRSRAAKRRNWERGGTAPQHHTKTPLAAIAPVGETTALLRGLPPSSLQITPEQTLKLSRLGLRSIGDLLDLPRAALARRFGADLLARLDQVTGAAPEPVSPAGQPLHFATRLSFPDPIGTEDDIIAAIDRLLPPLCDKLRTSGNGARRLTLTFTRTDSTLQILELGLARISSNPDRMRPLLTLQIPKVDPGFGIDQIRLQANVTEPEPKQSHKGHFEAIAAAENRRDNDNRLSDIIGRLGARIGLDAITHLHPAQSHIPEKGSLTMASAYSTACTTWPQPDTPRPIILFPPEAIETKGGQTPPKSFKWRRRSYDTEFAEGPERITPEWWLDDPNWRSGLRDYWRITTKQGHRLWLFQTYTDGLSNWFCQGDFG